MPPPTTTAAEQGGSRRQFFSITLKSDTDEWISFRRFTLFFQPKLDRLSALVDEISALLSPNA